MNSPLDYIRLTENFSLEGRAEQIRCPTLVCSAELDVIGVTARRLFDADLQEVTCGLLLPAIALTRIARSGRDPCSTSAPSTGWTPYWTVKRKLWWFVRTTEISESMGKWRETGSVSACALGVISCGTEKPYNRNGPERSGMRVGLVPLFAAFPSNRTHKQTPYARFMHQVGKDSVLTGQENGTCQRLPRARMLIIFVCGFLMWG